LDKEWKSTQSVKIKDWNTFFLKNELQRIHIFLYSK